MMSSNSSVSTSLMVMATQKSPATDDFELSTVTVTTAPPSSAQSGDAVAVGLNDPEGGNFPSHASSLRIPPVGVKATLSLPTSTSTAHSSPHLIGNENFSVSRPAIFTSAGERPLSGTTWCSSLILTVAVKVSSESPGLVISSGNVEPSASVSRSLQSGGHTTTASSVGASANAQPPPSLLLVSSVGPPVVKVKLPSASPSESSQFNWVRKPFPPFAFPLLEKNTKLGSSLPTPPGLKLNEAP